LALQWKISSDYQENQIAQARNALAKLVRILVKEYPQVFVDESSIMKISSSKKYFQNEGDHSLLRRANIAVKIQKSIFRRRKFQFPVILRFHPNNRQTKSNNLNHKQKPKHRPPEKLCTQKFNNNQRRYENL
jgi:hypothetical protein